MSAQLAFKGDFLQKKGSDGGISTEQTTGKLRKDVLGWMISTKLVKLNDLTRRVAEFLGKNFGGFFFLGQNPRVFYPRNFRPLRDE